MRFHNRDYTPVVRVMRKLKNLSRPRHQTAYADALLHEPEQGKTRSHALYGVRMNSNALQLPVALLKKMRIQIIVQPLPVKIHTRSKHYYKTIHTC
jgi:hypothetical protein